MKLREAIIDPSTDKVIDTIALSGKPETAVSDGAEKVNVNNENKSDTGEIDMKSLKIENTRLIAPGESPAGLSIDRKTKRLFAGCDNKMLVVMQKTDRLYARRQLEMAAMVLPLILH